MTNKCFVKLYLVEGSDCSISQGCFGGTAEELQHCRTANTLRIKLKHWQQYKVCTRYSSVCVLTGYSGSQLPGSAVGHVDNGRRSLVHHHLVLIPQAALDEVKQRTVMADGTETKDNTFNNLLGSTCSWCIIWLLQVCSPGLGLIQQFTGDPYQHAVGKGRLEARFGELVEHLGDGKAVTLPEVIQQAQSMVLGKKNAGQSAFWWRVTSSQHTRNISVFGLGFCSLLPELKHVAPLAHAHIYTHNNMKSFCGMHHLPGPWCCH